MLNFLLEGMPCKERNLRFKFEVALLTKSLFNQTVHFNFVTNSKKKRTKLAWGSYRTRAAMVPVLLYSKTKKLTKITITPLHGFIINLKPLANKRKAQLA